MITKLVAVGAALSILLSVPDVIAQQFLSQVDEIFVTSSRISVPLRQVGTSGTVVTAADLEAYGNLSLVDVLRQTPAIGSSNSGGVGKLTTLRIRGEEGYRTLVMFDGMRLLDPSAPDVQPEFSHILSSGIGRIEVLRGPQGLAYGADAGGVVNITTRRNSEGFEADFDVQSGEFDTQQISANLLGGNGQVDYFLSSTDFNTAGFNSRPSDSVSRDDDGYENTTLHGRLGFQFGDNWRMDLAHRDVEAENEFDACSDSSFSTVHDCVDSYGLVASQVSFDFQSENVAHRLAWFTVDSQRQSYSSGQPAFGTHGELERMEYNGSVSNLPGFDLVFGADREVIDSGSTSRENAGIYLEYLSDYSDSFLITAGIRHDYNDYYGTHNSYRVSGAYLHEAADGNIFKLRGAWGTGRTAPSPSQIEYNTGPFSYPPATLTSLDVPEISEGWELGLEYDFGKTVHLEAVYFDQEVEDDIFFDLVNFSGYLQEEGTSISEGIELATRIAVTATLDLTGNLTFNDAEQPDGNQRIRRPRKLVNFGLAYRALDERLSLNAFYRQSNDSIDEVFGLGIVPLDDFSVLDLNIRFKMTDNVILYGRVENAFDEEYMEILDYNSAGRALYFGVRIQI